MNYELIEKKYRKFGCEDFKLRDINDLKNIIDLDISECQYYDELSQEHKEMIEEFLVRYFNSWGLEYREGHKIVKAYVCQKQELLTEEDEDGIRTIVGSKFLNMNDANDIKIECISLPEDYEKIKDSLIWEVEKGYFGDVFLRVDLIDSEGREKWLHVYRESGEIQFY